MLLPAREMSWQNCRCYFGHRWPALITSIANAKVRFYHSYLDRIYKLERLIKHYSYRDSKIFPVLYLHLEKATLTMGFHTNLLVEPNVPTAWVPVTNSYKLTLSRFVFLSLCWLFSANWISDNYSSISSLHQTITNMINCWSDSMTSLQKHSPSVNSVLHSGVKLFYKFLKIRERVDLPHYFCRGCKNISLRLEGSVKRQDLCFHYYWAKRGGPQS